MKKLITTIGAVTGLLIGMPCLNAGGPDLKIERSVKVSFDSEVGKSYNAYSTTDVAKQKWELLGGPVGGGGEKIVFFYQSDDDQKVFFKVEETEAKEPKKLSLDERYTAFWNDHKNNFKLVLMSLNTGGDLTVIESSDIGKVEIEMTSKPDIIIKGEIEDDENAPIALTLTYKLLGENVRYHLALMPALNNQDDPEDQFWFGSFIRF